MTTSLAAEIYNHLPESLARGLITNNVTQRILRRIMPNQDIIIRSGVGCGLMFNCNRSNPAYSLGINEPVVQETFKSQLQYGDVLLDVGANVGFFSIIGAQLVGPKGHVYAFEPLPDNVNSIHHNLKLNGSNNVTVINAAVTDHSGKEELLVANYSGGSALSTVVTPPPDLKESIIVETVTIDEYLETGSLSRPKMVKIDVEGAEIFVLRGMVETIRQYRPVILYEIDDGEEIEFERKAQECATFLNNFNYQITPLAESYPDIGWYVGHFLAV